MNRRAERHGAASCVRLHVGRADGDKKLGVGNITAREIEEVGLLSEWEFAVGVVSKGRNRASQEYNLGLSYYKKELWN